MTDTAKPRSSARRTALRGALWTLGGYGSGQVLRLLSNLILAHLLFPGAFGLMALVNVFMQGLEMVSDIGIGPGIIRSKRSEDAAFLRTAWTVQVLRGVVLWLLTWVLARPVAAFFASRDPSAAVLVQILPISGLMALVGGFASTSVFTLNRRMALGRVTALNLVPQLVTVAVSILWAMRDPSVWAIVAGGLAQSVARVALSHALNPGPRDGFAWEAAARRELSSFGRWVMGSTLVTFLAMSIDRILLGRLLSLSELGLYAIGMTFARVATQVATRLGNAVIFPMLARYQDQPERMIAFCLRARHTVLWVSAAICSSFALVAPVFFSTLYDPRYAAAGFLSQWLALYVWAWVLTATMDRIPLALGRPHLLFASNVVNLAAMAFAAIGYRFFQLPGFITGMALANVSSHVFLLIRSPLGRRELGAQAVRFTIPLLLYTIPAAIALRHLPDAWSSVARVAVHLAAASLPWLVAAPAVWRLSTRDRESPS